MEILTFSLLLLRLLLTILSDTYVLPISSQCLSNQRLQLLQLKSSLQFNPATSTKLLQWNQTEDCCSWNGIACDGSGHVISLELQEEFISGADESWKALSALKHLERLNLASNRFDYRKFPEEICNLTNLRYLNLSDAGFTGQVPSCLSRMKKLVILDLSTGFRLSVGLHEILGDLTKLEALYLDCVKLSAQGNDWCKSVSSLSNLKVLSMANCYLSGPICSSLQNLSSLSVIQLDYNDLSTKVPEFFANFSNLTTLSLMNCNLHGQFPKKIFQVPTLQHLDLSGNYLITGSLPRFFSSQSFRKIALSYTRFSGSLTDSIGNLQSLSSLELSNCNFSGAIPSTLSNLKELAHLDLSYNKFNASIPSLQMFKRIEFIDLSHNALSDTIFSMHFEALTSLARINLGYNNLHGRIPSSLFALPSLRELQLSNNQLDGEIPEFSDPSPSSLLTLDLSSNHLGGSIPDKIEKLSELYILVLSNNSFTGTIPESLGNMTGLQLLDLSLNKLSGTIPTELQRLTSLSYLNLSFNQLFGKIPRGDNFQKFSYASFLGNSELCGNPLYITCNNIKPQRASPSEENLNWEIWTCASLGFILGIGIIFWLSLFRPRWWQSYNSRVDQVLLRILRGQRVYKNPIQRL